MSFFKRDIFLRKYFDFLILLISFLMDYVLETTNKSKSNLSRRKSQNEISLKFKI